MNIASKNEHVSIVPVTLSRHRSSLDFDKRTMMLRSELREDLTERFEYLRKH